MTALERNRKAILTGLLDRYESSATYRGENTVNQTFSITPTSVFPAYGDDWGSEDDDRAFDTAVEELIDKDLVTAKKDRYGRGYVKITLNTENLEETYALLKRKDKNLVKNERIKYYRSLMGSDDCVDAFCLDEIAKIEAEKKTRFEDKDVGTIAVLVKKVRELSSPIMMRELSEMMLKDSKAFERKYDKKVCYILSRYETPSADLNLMDREAVNVLLEEHFVLKNPAYVFFNGRGHIKFSNGNELDTGIGYPIGLPATAIRDITSFTIDSDKVLTVENLQAFNKITPGCRFVVYLAGYHAKVLTDVLLKIEGGDRVSWQHFGDMDPDGFQILKVLREKTGLAVSPYMMDTKTMDRYVKYGKPLENHDISLAKSLLEASEDFKPELEWMLEHSLKIEQEIVSF